MGRYDMVIKTLSIIGTAGRKDDGRRLTKESFSKMYKVAEELVRQLSVDNSVSLMSGGAAWADHTAVQLFLNKKVSGIYLYLPCEFRGGKFYDEMEYESVADTINHYHKLFSKTVEIDSLKDIKRAITEGAIVECGGGFKGRNTKISKANVLLAMTFGYKDVVKEGGTADTVRKYLFRCKREHYANTSYHYNLAEDRIYTGVRAPI